MLEKQPQGKSTSPLDGRQRYSCQSRGARALVRTFAATGGQAEKLFPLARSAVVTLTERLFALAAEAPAVGLGSGLLDELGVIAEQLTPRAG